MKTINKHAGHTIARRTSAIALAVATALGNAAMAADASVSVLEEIVVTAERRPINLQDVPTSATVLTSSGLENQGIDNVIEIQQVAPSVAISTYNRGTFINIRGVGIAQSAPTSNPGVAITSTAFMSRTKHLSHNRFTTSTASKCCAARKAP